MNEKILATNNYPEDFAKIEKTFFGAFTEIAK